MEGPDRAPLAVTATGGLARILDQALRQLGDAGQVESACRMAASAYALLERWDPGAAERFTGTLHHLTCRLPPESGRARAS
jgi:hypothetical protein